MRAEEGDETIKDYAKEAKAAKEELKETTDAGKQAAKEQQAD